MNDGNDDQNNSEIQKIEDLKEFLTNVCESMCLDALETKPKDIPNYMINFLQNRYGYSSSGLHYEEKKELEKLRSDVEIFRDMDEHTYYAELQKQVKKEIKVNEKKSKNPPKPKPRLPPDEIMVSDDEDYNDMDEIDQNLDNLEFIKKCNLNNKRIAVTENCFREEDEQIPIKTFKKSNELIEFMRINLMKSPIFSELPMDILRQCIEAMEEKNIPAVTDVFKQGEIGDSFFFVEEGELECKMQFIKVTKEGNRKKVEKFEPKLVKVYGPGDYFGELSLLYHNPRRGTIKAVTDAKLYSLNRNTYKKILRKANEDKISKKINIFRKVPILEALTDEELEKLDDITKEAIYYNGETIIKENEFSNVMFIIDKGRCIGTQTKEEGKVPEKVKDYREGDIIGEGALLKGERRQENIIANSDFVKLICLDRFSFKNNFGSLEQILMRNMDLYNIFFPPIQEEKPEEKPNEGKEEGDKNPNQNPSQPHNEQGKVNDINMSSMNITNLNNLNNNANNNTVNVEEIKKIKEEHEEEKKKITTQYEEKVEQLMKQLELLKSQNEKLQNQVQNPNVSEVNPNPNPNVEEHVFDVNNNVEENQNVENKDILKNINNNNMEENLNGQENNIENNNNNIDNEGINNNNNIDNEGINNNNNLEEQNQNKLEEVNNDNNINGEGSKNSSKLELIRDILAYHENDYQIKPENGENPGSPEGQNEIENAQLPNNDAVEENPSKMEVNNNINLLNNENKENEEFNENNLINSGDFIEN